MGTRRNDRPAVKTPTPEQLKAIAEATTAANGMADAPTGVNVVVRPQTGSVPLPSGPGIGRQGTGR